MRPSQIAEVIDREFRAEAAGTHTPAMLWGPLGVGKSQIIAQVAAAHGVRLIDIPLAQMESADLRGIPFRDGRNVVWSTPALAPGGPWRFESWEPIAVPAGLGGGGTRFTPVFEWVEEQGARPDALLYFTDALGEFPPAPPGYPVLWLVKGNAPVPWGERVRLN
ncbi:MAG TPA: VWA-like domain-containing protein [Burkholderiales bacterium]|nr:VWA-like domain-containing protein [Burkholderiales bacterium]